MRVFSARSAHNFFAVIFLLFPKLCTSFLLKPSPTHNQQRYRPLPQISSPSRKPITISTTNLHSSPQKTPQSPSSSVIETLKSPQALPFTALITLSGAVLGPFLDAYHSNFHVLTYDQPFSLVLWGTLEHPALVTSYWVPPLFGLAGFIIGWLYILTDAILHPPDAGQRVESKPSPPSPFVIFAGISFFTFQYYASGIMVASGMGREEILGILTVFAALGFGALDRTPSGLFVSAATAIGGPLIEVGLISSLRSGFGYHYSDLGETGFFPLWIVPVYFLGGPAVGNLARGMWSLLDEDNGVN